MMLGWKDWTIGFQDDSGLPPGCYRAIRTLTSPVSVVHSQSKAVIGLSSGQNLYDFPLETANFIVTAATVFYNVHGES